MFLIILMLSIHSGKGAQLVAVTAIVNEALFTVFVATSVSVYVPGVLKVMAGLGTVGPGLKAAGGEELQMYVG